MIRFVDRVERTKIKFFFNLNLILQLCVVHVRRVLHLKMTSTTSIRIWLRSHFVYRILNIVPSCVNRASRFVLQTATVTTVYCGVNDQSVVNIVKLIISRLNCSVTDMCTT